MTRRELSCEEVIEQLFAYLDRELDGELSADIAHHIARCRDCFTRAEFEKKLRARLAETTHAKAPERLQKRIKGILDRF